MPIQDMPHLLGLLPLALLLAFAQTSHAQGLAGTAGQAQPHALYINILEGEGALNDVRARTAREPVVEVTDENHRPVAGAIVLFVSDTNGSGGLGATFSGAQAFSSPTDAAGHAVGHGFQVTRTPGRFHISVEARSGDLRAHAVIHQKNLLVVSQFGLLNALATLGTEKSTLIIGLEVLGGAAAAGTVALTTQSSNSTTITIGTPTVGPPTTTAGIRIQLHRRSR
jgi:hypothetical protein